MKLRRLWCDIRDLARFRSPRLVPPKRLVSNVGYTDFRKTGDEFFRYFVDLCGLEPHHRVLDVGCGCGRMAVPLTEFLDEDRGSYDGFDITAAGIAWCNRAISARYPNFRFEVADIYNKYYHPEGKLKSTEYRFPYEDGRFDLVFLTSVFTHMLPDDVAHYSREIARVLKPSGRALITFFLLNDESLSLVRDGKSHLDFKHDLGAYRTIDAERVEAAVAFPEADVHALLRRSGLEAAPPVRYGGWCGRAVKLSYQDIVIAQRAS
jgi:SAM-dependent methyltransferase